jgi:threonine dehydrogenase-like Zn-dependent dehydrogenase
VLSAPGRCETVTIDTPRPPADGVLVQIEGCGVCGSNLPKWEGRSWFSYPGEPGNPGHEGWGRVAAVGPQARDVKLGDRVAFLSEHAFAEYDVTNHWVKLPASLDGSDIPGEPLGCVMNIWKRAAIAPGQNVAIIGVGFLGALLTQVATRAGANVIAVSQREFSRELAHEMGAIAAIDYNLSDDEIVKRIEALTDGVLCDTVIEVVGLQRPLDLAAKLCKVRGRVVIAGFHQDGPRQIDMFLWNWRGLDVINAHEREPSAYLAGIGAAVDGLASGKIDTSQLYTHRVKLDRAGDAFELLASRPDGFVKALVMP